MFSSFPGIIPRVRTTSRATSHLGLPHVAVVPNQTLPVSVHPQERRVAQQAHATPREKNLDVAMRPEGVLLSPVQAERSYHRDRPAGPG